MPALALNQGENAKYVNYDGKAMQFKFKKLIFKRIFKYFKILQISSSYHALHDELISKS